MPKEEDVTLKYEGSTMHGDEQGRRQPRRTGETVFMRGRARLTKYERSDFKVMALEEGQRLIEVLGG